MQGHPPSKVSSGTLMPFLVLSKALKKIPAAISIWTPLMHLPWIFLQQNLWAQWFWPRHSSSSFSVTITDWDGILYTPPCIILGPIHPLVIRHQISTTVAEVGSLLQAGAVATLMPYMHASYRTHAWIFTNHISAQMVIVINGTGGQLCV